MSNENKDTFDLNNLKAGYGVAIVETAKFVGYALQSLYEWYNKESEVVTSGDHEDVLPPLGS
ncbi:MAG: hypothetical protein KA998_00650 [Rickettsiaceae bacterium]|nr:hypothetical protein [Rickettsiaceae bacterium]